MNPPSPVTSTRYAVAVTLPGQAPRWYVPPGRDRSPARYGSRQQAEGEAVIIRTYIHPEPAVVEVVEVELVMRAVTVTVADAGRGEERE